MSIEDRNGRLYFGEKLYISQSTNSFELSPYGKNMIAGSLTDIFRVECHESTENVQIMTSAGSSGAGRAVAGAILFGPIGAIAGGLSGRKAAQYEIQTVANFIGFIVTYRTGYVQRFNVLLSCFGSTRTPYNSNIYINAKSLSALIVEELSKYVGFNQVNSEKSEVYISESLAFVPEVDFYSVRLLNYSESVFLFINVKNIGTSNIDNVSILVKGFDSAKNALSYLGSYTVIYNISAINIGPGEHDQLTSGINIACMGRVSIVQAAIYKFRRVNGEVISVPNNSLKWVEAVLSSANS